MEETKHQVIKYVAVWVALVAAFFILNMVVRSVAASRSDDGPQNGYYASGRQASNSSGVQKGGLAFGTGGSCCANGGPAGAGGGCYSGAARAAGGSVDFKQLEQAAINWYARNYGDADVTAEVKDFGCHQQINILKDGKVVKELQYRNGQLSLLQ